MRLHLGLPAAIGLAAPLLLLAPTLVSAQTLSRDQQACAKTFDKDFAKSVGAHARIVSSCIKNFGKGRLTGTAQDCLSSDSRGKFSAAKHKAARDHAKACSGPALAPYGVGLPGRAALAASTMGGELVARMFGPDLDLALVREATDRATARCQRSLEKDASKCRKAKLKGYHGCKSKGLKAGSITNAAGLEACIGDDTKGKTARACGPSSRLSKDVGKKCAGVDLAQAFPACTTPDLYTCVEREIECMTCLAIDEADALSRDCDLFDDGLANASCLPIDLPGSGPWPMTPVSVFTMSSVYPQHAPGATFFTGKKTQNFTPTQDTWFGGFLVPAGTTVKVSQYSNSCDTLPCISLAPGQLSNADATAFNQAVLTRSDGTASRLDIAQYLGQSGAASREVWRWSVLGDSLPNTSEDVALMRAANLKLMPTISADRADLRHPGFPLDAGRACVPFDLQDTFDERFGYSELYFDWVTSLLNLYGDVMPVLIIENEVDQDGNTWCEPLGVRDGYAKMVITAKYAVRQAGSSTRIADSGMMGGSWARMTFLDLMEQRQAIIADGGTPPAALDDEILEVGSQFTTVIPVTNTGDVDWDAVDAAVPDIELVPSVINAREVVRLLNSEVVDPDLGEPALDVFNFHHHDASGAVSSIVGYIRKAFAKGGEPLINNEMGLVRKSVFDKTLGAGNTEILNRTQFVPLSPLTLNGEIEQTGGVTALGHFGTLTRQREIATGELIKKLVIHFANGVRTVSYFGFNGGADDDAYTRTALAGVDGAAEDQYFLLPGMNYSSVLSNDHLPVAPNIRALLNLKDLFDSPVLSSTHAVVGLLESYEFTLVDKRIVAAWVPAYQANIGQSAQVNVAAEIAAGCSFYDLEGFDIVPDAQNEITIAMSPAFYVCPL